MVRAPGRVADVAKRSRRASVRDGVQIAVSDECDYAQLMFICVRKTIKESDTLN